MCNDLRYVFSALLTAPAALNCVKKVNVIIKKKPNPHDKPAFSSKGITKEASFSQKNLPHHMDFFRNQPQAFKLSYDLTHCRVETACLESWKRLQLIMTCSIDFVYHCLSPMCESVRLAGGAALMVQRLPNGHHHRVRRVQLRKRYRVSAAGSVLSDLLHVPHFNHT